MPKLTIVTITRNNYEQLVGTTDSLKLIPHYHHIVINGGECERTKKFLIERKIDHISEPDEGIADAFNKGIRKFFETDSDYVIFINSGDRICNASYVAKAIEFLERNESFAFTYGDIIFQDPSGGNRYIQARNPINFSRGMPCHQTMIYRKSVFERGGLFDTSYKIAMDYQHLGRMLKAGLAGKYITAPPAILFDGEGVSSTRRLPALRETCRALFDTGMIWQSKRGFFSFLLWSLLVETLIVFRVKDLLTKKFNLFRYRMPLPPSADLAAPSPQAYAIVINTREKDAKVVERVMEHSWGQKPSPRRVVLMDHNENKLRIGPGLATNPPVEHIHVPDRGISSTINRWDIPPGVEWVLFCNDDECLSEGYVEKFFEMVECRPWAEIVASGLVGDGRDCLCSPRDESGASLNKFLHAKLSVDFHFACRARTFKRLDGFDARLGTGLVAALDFVWKAHFKRIPMFYCSELRELRVRQEQLTVSENFDGAFYCGKDRGALIAKWVLERKKIKPLGEMLDVTAIYLGQIFKCLFTGSFPKMALSFVALMACYLGFLLFTISHIKSKAFNMFQRSSLQS